MTTRFLSFKISLLFEFLFEDFSTNEEYCYVKSISYKKFLLIDSLDCYYCGQRL